MKHEYSREKHLEATLRNLLQDHFSGRELKWDHTEDVMLCEIDPELYLQIVELIPEAINNE